MVIKVGKKIAKFKIKNSVNQIVSEKDFLGKITVLYFYPKDNTSGCTKESLQFSELFQQFKKKNIQIFGVSRDSVKSHVKFKEKYDFPFELLSDENEELCQLFDVIKEKNMYGKKVMGIERSTFIFDENGVLIQEFRKVKADGHAAEVYTFCTKK